MCTLLRYRVWLRKSAVYANYSAAANGICCSPIVSLFNSCHFRLAVSNCYFFLQKCVGWLWRVIIYDNFKPLYIKIGSRLSLL